MQYRYEFEIAAFLLLLIIFLHYLFVRQFPTKKAHIFMAVLGASILECAFNIASSLGLANAKFVPQSVNELLAFAFFVFEGLVSGCILKFVVCLDKGQTKGGHWEI